MTGPNPAKVKRLSRFCALLVVAFVSAVAAGCAGSSGNRRARSAQGGYSVDPDEGGFSPLGEGELAFADRAGSPKTRADQTGLATWYGPGFNGRPTTSGEVFDASRFTAAHRSLPFGTWVEVRRVDTGKRVRVRINDRGPWGDRRRIIDLSRAAAQVIDLTNAGYAKVELRVVKGP